MTKNAPSKALSTRKPPAGQTVSARVFKTKWFAKKAKSEGIEDDALCIAIAAVMQGKADDLGGGVWKKRLNDNMLRSIILAKGGENWIYTFLFAKKNRDNIDPDELASFKKLAKLYAAMTLEGLDEALRLKELLEICHDCKTR